MSETGMENTETKQVSKIETQTSSRLLEDSSINQQNRYLENAGDTFKTENGQKMYKDPNGSWSEMPKHGSIRNSRGESISWNGIGFDQHNRGFILGEDGMRDYGGRSAVAPRDVRPNWDGNKKPNYTTDPTLREMSYKGSKVLAYDSVHGPKIDWIETEARSSGRGARGLGALAILGAGLAATILSSSEQAAAETQLPTFEIKK